MISPLLESKPLGKTGGADGETPYKLKGRAEGAEMSAMAILQQVRLELVKSLSVMDCDEAVERFQ